MSVGNLTYTYDNLGNIKTVKEGTELKESYTYDSLNQLTRHDSVTQNKTIVYTYDAGGNILNRKEYAYTTDADLSALTPETTVPYTYGDTTWKDKLTAYDGQSIAYDAIGNPITYRGWSNTWQGRQLASTSQGGMTLSFKYNVDGIRTQKTVNGTATNYFLNGNKILAQKTGSTVTWFYYDQQGTRVAMEHGGKLYYYLYNLQGDVIALCDASSKQIVAKYSYNAWGKLLTKENLGTGTIADINPFRYRGYYYDSETRLYYVSSRYYDPEIGRWINADGELAGTGGDVRGYNLFVYSFNNPVNMEDPTGQWPKWLKGALNVVSGALQMAAGAALGATVGWTGIGAVAAGFLIVNGAATATQGVGQIVNHVKKSNVMREDNIVRTGVKSVGKAIGGRTGEKVAAGVYDTAVVAANLYAGKVGLQQAGVAPVKVPINKVLNNPLDEFVTVGPAQGVISNYCRTIPTNGYGRISATALPNGYYQLADGHHRVAALRSLGYETIKIFLTK